MEGNTIEKTTKQVTQKEQGDFPYKARELFGLVTEKEKCNEQQQAEKLFGGNK